MTNYDLPCKHRGEPTGEIVQCGCSLQQQPAYFCNSPDVEKDRCLMRIGARAKRGVKDTHAECSSCDWRFDDRPVAEARRKQRAEPAADVPRAPIGPRPGDVYRAMSLARREEVAARCKQNPGEPLIVECDDYGYGDAVIMSWIAEGSKSSDNPCYLKATGSKRELLEILGQEVRMYGRAISQRCMVRKEECAGYAHDRVPFRAEAIGVTEPPMRPTITLPDEVHQWAKEALGDAVLLAPQSAHANREWAPERWAQLAQALERMEIPFMFTGTAARKELRGFPGLYGVSPFQKAVGLIVNAKSVIGIDSFIVNLAGTANIPTVCILSFTTPQVFSHTPSVRCIKRGGDINSITATEVVAQYLEMQDALRSPAP